MQSQYYKRVQGSEDGIYLPFFAILVIALLAVAALAIDAGNLFLRKIQLQNASDLASAGGLGFRALQGWAWFQGYDRMIPRPGMVASNRAALKAVGPCNNTECKSRIRQLQDRTQEMATANLRLSGIDPAKCRVDTEFDLVTDEIRVTIYYNVPLFFVSYLPMMDGCNAGHTCPIKVTTEGKLRPANVVAMLDRSGSMNCPSTDSDPNVPCSCRIDSAAPNCTAADITADERKIYDLKDATFNFLSFFNPNKDRVSVVPFQTLASADFSMHRADNSARNYGEQIDALEQIVDGLTPSGNTNHCDALWTGYSDAAEATVPGGGTIPDTEPFFGLLFTDGAPSAGRFAFVDGNEAGTAPGNVLYNKRNETTPALSNDWLMYLLEWQDAALTPPRWLGPTPLFHRSSLPSDLSGGSPPGAGVISCGQFTPDAASPTVFLENQFHTVLNNGGDPAKPCLKSFRFYPTFFGDGNTSTWVGDDGNSPAAGITPEAAPDIQLNESLDFANQSPAMTSPYWYVQKFYDCAIEASDFFRRRGGVIYTVGLGAQGYLGNPLVPAEGNRDPYQNPLNDFSRKEFFLRRVAYDSYRAGLSGDPSFGPRRSIGVTDPNDPRNSGDVWVGYDEHKGYGSESFGDRRGSYSGTNNPKELNSLFTRVAKNILLQLVQ